jgi:hypothetical protein
MPLKYGSATARNAGISYIVPTVSIAPVGVSPTGPGSQTTHWLVNDLRGVVPSARSQNRRERHRSRVLPKSAGEDARAPQSFYIVTA